MKTSFNTRRPLWLVLALFILVTGCTSNTAKPIASSDDGFDFQPEENPDRFESFNRKVFAFNLSMDRWILKPIAQSYRWLAPQAVEAGVSNFFRNLGEIKNVTNDLLQGKWQQAGNDSGRFLLNSTVGLAGVFDVATNAGLKKNQSEDFGQTLAIWGVPRGPYLMLPFLGPTTARAGIALPADWVLSPMNEVTPVTPRYAMVATEFIQARAQLLDFEDLASGDLYLFVRDAYLQQREYLVNDGKIQDNFGDGDFGDDDFGDEEFDPDFDF
ncbi:MAG: VacJ family lipoprotein [Cellvibrionaceae bacterium]|nr:VacJ family lipoprotein [Cellvibrionaceae bacterium]